MVRVSPLAWALLRYARRVTYSAIGRNPLVQRSHAPEFSTEWAAVRGLVRASHIRPVRIDSDDGGRGLWTTSLGDMWFPPGAGESTIRMLSGEIYAGVYRLSLGDKVLLDCGANVGFFSRYAFMNGAERVIAFEPSPGNAACLRKNLARELADGRFTLIEMGVWDAAATLYFNAGNQANPGTHYVKLEGQPGDIQVQVVSIDSVVEQSGLTKLDYIKMDVEGSEVAALRGAAQTIRRFVPRLSVATEHTDDLLENSIRVIDTIRKTESSYDYVCTEAHGYRSRSGGQVLTPYCIFFESSKNALHCSKELLEVEGAR